MKVLWVGVFFAVVFLTGLWMNNSERPLNTIIFTIHKLVALAVLGFIIKSTKLNL